MTVSSSRHPSCPVQPAGRPRRAILLTSYQTGATRGRNLGKPGYSYDFVAQLFVPLLARWGEVIPVERSGPAVEAAIRSARQRGLEPVQVSFLPFQDMYLSPSAPNVAVPAWEFPDVPSQPFDGNPHNDWVSAANRCDLVIVGGPFTVETFQRGGIRTPIHVVPVPTPQAYFQVPCWQPGQTVSVGCPALVFPHSEIDSSWDEPAPVAELPSAAPARRGPRLREMLRHGYRRYLRPLVPPVVHRGLRRLLGLARVGDPWMAYRRSCRRTQVDLSGVVYVSIFNPGDGRKNWEDLLSGFLAAVGDQEEATLVVKLITRDSHMIEQVLAHYRALGLGHRCKIVFITDYLSEAQMLDLVHGATYYLQTTRAEGNCLPLMNYLAAGRPGISPCHTAIGDYFNADVGFPVFWHPEPTSWPQLDSVRIRTSWGRLIWPHLVEQIRTSFYLARQAPAGYQALSARGRARMAGWAHEDRIVPRLLAALDGIEEKKAAYKHAA